MDQAFQAIVEAMRMIREGSESTGRTIRMCLLVALLAGTVVGIAWVMHVIGA